MRISIMAEINEKKKKHLRPTKDIAKSTKYLREAADNNVGKWKYLNVEMVSNCFVKNDREVVQVGKCTQTRKVGSTKLWVPRNVGEKRQYSRTVGCTFFKKLFEVINAIIGEYVIARSCRSQEGI